eukprot:4000374-Amphidinium_carterae.1
MMLLACKQDDMCPTSKSRGELAGGLEQLSMDSHGAREGPFPEFIPIHKQQKPFEFLKHNKQLASECPNYSQTLALDMFGSVGRCILFFLAVSPGMVAGDLFHILQGLHQRGLVFLFFKYLLFVPAPHFMEEQQEGRKHCGVNDSYFETHM